MRKKDGNPDFVGLSDDDALRLVYRRDGADLRTRYDRTLQALDASFDPSDVFTALYEEFFTEAEIERLSAFLGTEPRFDLITQRWNGAAKTEQVDPALLAEVRAHFADVYDYCAHRFPRSRKLWH